MLARQIFIVSFVLYFLLGCIGCSTAWDIQPAWYPSTIREVKGTSSIIFVSDTQSPLWIETIRLKADKNEDATRLILNTIAEDSTCVALFHLGDITALGSAHSFWEEFDGKTTALRNAGIPMFPVFGNHEYMPFAKSGKENMTLRFPFMVKESWYYKRIGSLAMVMLNSNISQLTNDEILTQQYWFEQTLNVLDSDTSVSLTLVGCHHSPYTNSTIVDSSFEMQTLFIPAFMKSKKAQLFLSGHSHAFEHFQIEGKEFLVIGGGGGLLQPLLTGTKQRRSDKFKGDERRFFHYARLLPGKAGLIVQILKVNSRVTGFEKIYELQIPYIQ